MDSCWQTCWAVSIRVRCGRFLGVVRRGPEKTCGFCVGFSGGAAHLRRWKLPIRLGVQWYQRQPAKDGVVTSSDSLQAGCGRTGSRRTRVCDRHEEVRGFYE
jgi:hypothetical protein